MILNCTPKNQIDYKEQNKRFDFSNRDNLLESLELYFKDFGNDQAIEKLNNVTFIKVCETNVYELIEKNTYENFIEKNPEEFLCFIEYLNSYNQLKNLDAVYFNSSQAFLRFLTPIKAF